MFAQGFLVGACVSARTVRVVDLLLARRLTRSSGLTLELQRRIWSLGDLLACTGLASREDFAQELFVEVLASGDERMLLSWSQFRYRPPGELRRAVAVAQDEHLLASLAGQRSLPDDAAQVLAVKATGLVAACLLDRASLPSSLRPLLVSRCLAGSAAVVSDPANDVQEVRLLRARVAGVPDAELAALRVLPPRLSRFLGELMCLEDVRVQREAVAAVARLSVRHGMSDGDRATLERALRRVLQVGPLDPAVVDDVLLLVPVFPGLGDLAVARSRFDGLAACASLGCTVDGPVRSDELHVAAVRDLLSAGSECRVPRRVLAAEAFVHADVLPQGAFVSVVSHLLGDVAVVAADWEVRLGASGGSVDPLVALVRSTGQLALSSLVDPVPVVRVLARGGDLVVSSSSRVPEAAWGTVLWEFADVSKLLADRLFMDQLLTQVLVLEPSVQETVWGLLPGWSGSCGDLVAAASAL